MASTPAMKYNPAFLTEEELIRNFVVRQKDLELILEVLRENGYQNNQHILVVAPRGAGKTTLVLRVASEIRRNKAFSKKWYPVVFSEESYEVCTPGEFWLEAIFQIGHQTKNRRWKDVHEDLRRESNEYRLRERALSQLMDFADERNRRLLLIVENLNMMLGQQISLNDAWKLRHTLVNEPRIMLLGTAVSRFDQLDNSENAMFELFRMHNLEPLDTDECLRLWESTTSELLDVNRIRPIQILTGGNLRLLVIISNFVSKTSLKELMENLTRLVDEHTEFFKSHLDNLPAQERKIFVTLADIWNPATAKEIADFTRIGVNKVSAHLQRLMSKGAVVVANRQGGKKWYQVAERMYNIYHLMRRRGAPARRVRAVVNFMVSFYEPEELVRTTGRIAQEACKLEDPEREAHYLAYQGIVENLGDDHARQAIFGNKPSNFFESESVPQDLRQLAHSIGEEENIGLPFEAQKGKVHSGDMIKKAFELAQSPEKVLEAERVLREAVGLHPDDASTWAQLGALLHERLDRYEEAEAAYRKAIEIDLEYHWAWAQLGALLHNRLDRYEEAEAAYRKAIEIKPEYLWAWAQLGALLHERLDRYEEAEAAYRKAIEIDPEYHWAWARIIELKLQSGLAPFSDILKLAKDRIKKYSESAALHNTIAWIFFKNAPRSYLSKALVWARRAVELDPDNPHYEHTLASILAATGSPEESLQHAKKYINNRSVVKSLLEDWINLFVNIAAAGCPRKTLEALQDSPSANLMEPLLAGLRLFLDEEVKAPVEVMEVARDVEKRIEEQREKINREAYSVVHKGGIT